MINKCNNLLTLSKHKYKLYFLHKPRGAITPRCYFRKWRHVEWSMLPVKNEQVKRIICCYNQINISTKWTIICKTIWLNFIDFQVFFALFKNVLLEINVKLKYSNILRLTVLSDKIWLTLKFWSTIKKVDVYLKFILDVGRYNSTLKEDNYNNSLQQVW